MGKQQILLENKGDGIGISHRFLWHAFIELLRVNLMVQMKTLLLFQGLLDIEFDPNSDEFTLEFIVQHGFDKFANVIGDISSAATKELQIEVVNFALIFKTAVAFIFKALNIPACS